MLLSNKYELVPERIEPMKKYPLSVLLIIICAVISATFRLGSSPRDEHDRVKIDSEWEIRFRDRKYNCTAPEKQRLSSVFPIKKGDHIELSTILPKYPFRQPEVEFTSQCSVVRVYLDRELIYSYGEQEEAKNRLVGSGRMCVPLPGDPYGKELTITLDVCENRMFTRVSKVYIQDTKYYIQNILRDNIWLLGVALLILAIGIVLLSIALIMTVMSNYKTRSVIYLSGFAISTAVCPDKSGKSSEL